MSVRVTPLTADTKALRESMLSWNSTRFTLAGSRPDIVRRARTDSLSILLCIQTVRGALALDRFTVYSTTPILPRQHAAAGADI